MLSYPLAALTARVSVCHRLSLAQRLTGEKLEVRARFCRAPVHDLLLIFRLTPTATVVARRGAHPSVSPPSPVVLGHPPTPVPVVIPSAVDPPTGERAVASGATLVPSY